jgi:oligopeptide/dipeptide ABC transporter ATP-binding protein
MTHARVGERPAGDNATSTPVVELVDAAVRYDGSSQHAVSGVSLQLRAGEILGLVGESGCGKSTTARALLALAPLAEGHVRLHGESITQGDPRLRRSVQAIFQNPAASFNPKRSLVDSVAEPIRVRKIGTPAERHRRALAELDRVGITETMAGRRPHEVSGGQCQRAAIARATILRPEALVCDEPVSALDVSIQAQILELLAELRREDGLAMLFISHDLSVVAALCDRTAVMYAGQVVEEGTTPVIARSASHPYSVILQESAPTLDLVEQPRRLVPRIPADEVDVRALPGCRFTSTCPLVTELCHDTAPALLGDEHRIRCHHPVGSGDPAGTGAPS